MNAIKQMLSHELASALGWTLLHSLWQCALIFLVVIAALRLIPAAFSKARYAVACGGLALLFGSSVITFAYIANSQPHHPGVQETTNVPVEFAAYGGAELSPGQNFLASLTTAAETYMPFILTMWMAGFVFFAIRLSAGLWYTGRLKSEATPFENEWSNYINTIGRQLGITRPVTLAESRSITSPMVIGYLKPVILIPVGMLTGMTTEQLETIFVHELAHIKRHDYLINFIQSFLETVFFFNPFVWILSNVIRNEREYCCDDVVIRHHGDTRAYAYALTNLAEARLSTQTFALSLAGDKSLLFDRIRRIIEKSAKNRSSNPGILLSAILLTGGLLCISWLGVQQEKPHADSAAVDHDTTAMFALPQINTLGIPDSLPLFPFSDHESWEDMAKAFEERFREFELRSADAEKHIKEWEEKFQWKDWTTKFDSLRVQEDVLQRLGDFEAFHELEKSLEHLRGLQMEDLRKMERVFQNHENIFRSYEQVLREELIEDGYLSEGETIESLQWDDTLFKVNGKKIKDSDLQKYQELHDKYFPRDLSGKVE